MNVWEIVLLAIGIGLFVFNVVKAFIGYGNMRAIDARYHASKEAYKYTKDDMFAMFRAGRSSAGIAYPYPLMQVFEEALQEYKAAQQKRAADKALPPHQCDHTHSMYCSVCGKPPF